MPHQQDASTAAWRRHAPAPQSRDQLRLPGVDFSSRPPAGTSTLTCPEQARRALDALEQSLGQLAAPDRGGRTDELDDVSEVAGEPPD